MLDSIFPYHIQILEFYGLFVETILRRVQKLRKMVTCTPLLTFGDVVFFWILRRGMTGGLRLEENPIKSHQLHKTLAPGTFFNGLWFVTWFMNKFVFYFF